jgi:hypothetical protein
MADNRSLMRRIARGSTRWGVVGTGIDATREPANGLAAHDHPPKARSRQVQHDDSVVAVVVIYDCG